MAGTRTVIPLILAAILAPLACAQDLAGARESAGSGEGFPGRIPLPTWGGSQLWADVHVLHEWRIQERAGHGGDCRLLGPKEFCHATGSFEKCLKRLGQIQRSQQIEPIRGRAVVILHGLGASRWTMRRLADYLQDQGGYTIVNVEYPSTRGSMADHARSLARVIDGLPEVEELDFVGHSMGNIVIRHYMADIQRQWGRPDPRWRRVVMIAPPNHGSLAATRLSDNSVFKTVLGKPGRQLGTEWTWLESDLATPPCPFGIIAGGRGGGGGFSPFLPGDDDGRIAVNTTRLKGASDFVLVPMIHELIANDSRTFKYTLSFLANGFFVAEDQRQPVLEHPPAEIANRRPPAGDGSQSPPPVAGRPGAQTR
ncbi:MAG: alpha/beta hydrolase [Pirellulales bacterium]|nr:alpha/beta hydrolase [Thermoguttaceae bacterium]MDD4786720.1 alpha/beta hydrolase [Pirellulales bacterium]MDI9443883.1 alpha/beta hydrolase [Planctomycetota bacterium]NLY99049.1 alpha/beta hydrolase [Pirellulaceae bacterium]